MRPNAGNGRTAFLRLPPSLPPSLSGRCSVSEWSVREGERVASPPPLSLSFGHMNTRLQRWQQPPPLARRQVSAVDLNYLPSPSPPSRAPFLSNTRARAGGQEGASIISAQSVGRSVRHAPRPAHARPRTMNVIQRIKNLHDLDPVHGEAESGGQG